MSKREKIIVALMVVAVLYGAYNFLGSSEQEGPAAQTADGVAALNEYVLGIAGTMPQLTLNETEKYVIASAVTRWTGDPFLRTKTLERDGKTEIVEATTTEKLNASYTGYVEMNGRRLAIINGREYAPGEELEASGFIVRQIGPSKVELGKRGSGETIAVPLEEMFTQQEYAPSPDNRL